RQGVEGARGDAAPPALGSRARRGVRRGGRPPGSGAARTDLGRGGPLPPRAHGVRLRRRDLAAQRQPGQPPLPAAEGSRQGQPRPRSLLGRVAGRPAPRRPPPPVPPPPRPPAHAPPPRPLPP